MDALTATPQRDVPLAEMARASPVLKGALPPRTTSLPPSPLEGITTSLCRTGPREAQLSEQLRSLCHGRGFRPPQPRRAATIAPAPPAGGGQRRQCPDCACSGRPRLRPAAAPFILREDNCDRTGGMGKGIPFSHGAAGPRHAALFATAASPQAAKRQSPLSAPSEQRAPTCSQHPQLTDRSGPPSAAATTADWLLPASFSCSLHSEWLRRPPLQGRARPSP